MRRDGAYWESILCQMEGVAQHQSGLCGLFTAVALRPADRLLQAALTVPQDSKEAAGRLFPPPPRPYLARPHQNAWAGFSESSEGISEIEDFEGERELSD
jgi:hypothetical protein